MSLVANDPAVGNIHDQLLDEAGGDLASAFDDSCAVIRELRDRLWRLEGAISAGYVRTDTGHLYAKRVEIKFPPPDDPTTDDWLKTGVERE